jgi:hypothetical protein
VLLAAGLPAAAPLSLLLHVLFSSMVLQVAAYKPG